jgi:hypothetical protein
MWMDLGISPSKAEEVGLKSCFLEPAKHGVKLLAQDERTSRVMWSSGSIEV